MNAHDAPETTEPPPGFSSYIWADHSPFVRLIGPIWYRSEAGTCCLVTDLARHHLDASGNIHTGVLLALADTVMSRAVASLVGGGKAATLALNCSFLGPGPGGTRIEGQAKVRHRTRSIIFVASSLSADGTVLARADGLWKNFEARRS